MWVPFKIIFQVQIEKENLEDEEREDEMIIVF